MMNRLDPSQKRAAEHHEGPALVLAGPGSGKTTTLIARYLRLVERGISPASIFTTTFTRASADELKSRAERGGVRVRGLPVGTFHGLCARLLRERGGELAREVDVVPDFGILGEGEQYAVMRELQLHEHFELDVLKEALGRFKEQLITPTEAMAEAKRTESERDRASRVQLAVAYQCYQDALWRAQRFDFGDLIMLTVRALRRSKPLREKLSRRFAFVMVDEFQDINAAQHALVTSLLETHNNVWVVGDDDQAIYGWRGSDVGFITGFEEHWKDAARYVLEYNYRSQPWIVSASQTLIARNRRRLEKVARVGQEDLSKHPLRLCSASDETHEADWIVKALSTMVKHGLRGSDIAVLARTHHVLLAVENALSRTSIPYVVRGGKPVWTLPEVRVLIEVFAEGVTGRRSGGGSMPWMRSALRELLPANLTQDNLHRTMTRLSNHVAHHAPQSASSERRMQWSEAARAVDREVRGCETPQEALAHLRGLQKGKRKKTAAHATEKDVVTLSTMHQAKGLEWRAVFVVGCEDELIPHEQAYDFEEERRLFFVAVTRAKSFLSVTWARFRGGRETRRSPFVDELIETLPRDAQAWRHHPDRGPRPGGRSTTSSTQPKREQMRVWHAKLGYGVVTGVEDDKWTVRFVSSGLKKIKRQFLEVL